MTCGGGEGEGEGAGREKPQGGRQREQEPGRGTKTYGVEIGRQFQVVRDILENNLDVFQP